MVGPRHYRLPALLLGLWILAGTSAADPPPKKTVVDEVLPATAWIVAGNHSGSGFLVDASKKLVITNAHVVGKQKTAMVTFPAFREGEPVRSRRYYFRTKKRLLANVLAVDPSRDLAVLELQGRAPNAAALLLAPASARLSERVTVVGNPGVNTELWQSTAAAVKHQAFLRVKDPLGGPELQARLLGLTSDRPVEPGYSGGPVVNGKGQVVGITTKSNAAIKEFWRIAPHLSGALVAVPAGPAYFLPFYYGKAPTLANWAWGVEASEIDDVVVLVREHAATARTLLAPRAAADHYQRGAFHVERLRLDLAVLDFSNAIRLDPKYAAAYRGRAGAFRLAGALPRAFADVNEAIRLDPRDARAYYERGLEQAARRSFPQALADLARALELDPTDANFYRDRSIVWVEQKKFEQAFADAARAVQLDPKNTRALRLHGNLLARRGRFAAAVTDYKQALALDPKDAWTYNELAWLWASCPVERLRDGKQALAYANRACEMTNHRIPALLDTLAAAHAECGEFTKATEWQKKAHDLAPAGQKAEFQARLQLYRAGKPYRQLEGLAPPFGWSLGALWI